MTWVDLAKEEGLKLGIHLTDEMADYILWEETAFPHGGKQYIREQVTAVLNANLYAMKTSFPPPPSTAPTRFERIE